MAKAHHRSNFTTWSAKINVDYSRYEFEVRNTFPNNAGITKEIGMNSQSGPNPTSSAGNMLNFGNNHHLIESLLAFYTNASSTIWCLIVEIYRHIYLTIFSRYKPTGISGRAVIISEQTSFLIVAPHQRKKAIPNEAICRVGALDMVSHVLLKLTGCPHIEKRKLLEEVLRVIFTKVPVLPTAAPSLRLWRPRRELTAVEGPR